MPTLPVDKERLARENPSFRRMVDKHSEYERRLAELRARLWLNEEEKLEEVRLKKLKLALKDEMESILRERSEA